MSPFIILLGLIPAGIIFFLGRYIGMTGYVEVLKNYDEKKSYDKEAYTSYVKNLMLFTSISTVSMVLVMFVLALIIKSIDFVTIAIVLYILITLNYIIRLKLSHRKFEIKE